VPGARQETSCSKIDFCSQRLPRYRYPHHQIIEVNGGLDAVSGIASRLGTRRWWSPQPAIVVDRHPGNPGGRPHRPNGGFLLGQLGLGDPALEGLKTPLRRVLTC
jgi:hypothetical protein